MGGQPIPVRTHPYSMYSVSPAHIPGPGGGGMHVNPYGGMHDRTPAVTGSGAYNAGTATFTQGAGNSGHGGAQGGSNNGDRVSEDGGGRGGGGRGGGGRGGPKRARGGGRRGNGGRGGYNNNYSSGGGGYVVAVTTKEEVVVVPLLWPQQDLRKMECHDSRMVHQGQHEYEAGNKYV